MTYQKRNRDLAFKGLFIVRKVGQSVSVRYGKETLYIDLVEFDGRSVRMRFDGPASFEVDRPADPTKDCRMCK